MPPYPMAASVAVAPVLAGALRPVRVAAAAGQAWYLTTSDPRLPVLCLAGPDAVRVPCAVLVAADHLALASASGAVGPGGTASPVGTVGGSRLALGGLAARVTRWWRPPPLPRLARVDADRLAAAATDLAARLLGRPGADEADRLAAALRAGSAERAARDLLGRGPGLTPLADDVLAGALVALRARAAGAAGPLAAAVAALAPARTTFVSAALLRHAAAGECLPQLAALLAVAGRGGRLDATLEALLGVGHTSGSGLAHGVRVGLGAAP